MTCEELRALLDAEGEADSEAARAHLRSCASCAREVERWLTVRTALHELGQEPAPPFLHARVMAGVRAESRPGGERSWLRGWRARALAAVGAAVVILGLGLFRAVRPPLVPPPIELPSAAERAAVAGSGDKGSAGPPVAVAAVPAPTVAVPSGSAARRQQAVAVQERVSAAAPARGVVAVAKAGSGAAPAKPEAAAVSPVVAGAAAGQESGQVAPPAVAALAEARGDASLAGSLRALEGKPAPGAELVRCRLQLEGDGEVLDLELPVAEAPSPHEVWSVTVAPDGRVEVLDSHGRSQQAPSLHRQVLSQRLQQLGSGQYRLSQIPARATPAP